MTVIQAGRILFDHFVKKCRKKNGSLDLVRVAEKTLENPDSFSDPVEIPYMASVFEAGAYAI